MCAVNMIDHPGFFVNSVMRKNKNFRVFYFYRSWVNLILLRVNIEFLDKLTQQPNYTVGLSTSNKFGIDK